MQSFPIAVKRPKGYERGKRFSDKEWKQVYLKTSPKNLHFPTLDKELVSALENQLKLLKRRKARKNRNIKGIDISVSEMKATIEMLLNNRKNPSNLMEEQLEAYQIRGKDGKGNVFFTG